MGLVQPGRASGGGRRYSARDVALLREIQRLSQDDGVNLAGVKRVIELEQLTYELQQRLASWNVAHLVTSSDAWLSGPASLSAGSGARSSPVGVK